VNIYKFVDKWKAIVYKLMHYTLDKKTKFVLKCSINLKYDFDLNGEKNHGKT